MSIQQIAYIQYLQYAAAMTVMYSAHGLGMLRLS